VDFAQGMRRPLEACSSVSYRTAVDPTDRGRMRPGSINETRNAMMSWSPRSVKPFGWVIVYT